MKNISIIEGDLTKAAVDAVVNAANPVMLGGGGVDGAIHRAAGPELRKACMLVPAVNGIRCPVGEARITSAFNLPARYVIHTVGPIYHSDPEPEKHLESAYKSSLRLAMENNCRTVAFPAISCGAYGYPHKDAAKIALGVCGRPEYRDLHISFYLSKKETVKVWKEVWKELPEQLKCSG